MLKMWIGISLLIGIYSCKSTNSTLRDAPHPGHLIPYEADYKISCQTENLEGDITIIGLEHQTNWMDAETEEAVYFRKFEAKLVRDGQTEIYRANLEANTHVALKGNGQIATAVAWFYPDEDSYQKLTYISTGSGRAGEFEPTMEIEGDEIDAKCTYSDSTHQIPVSDLGIQVEAVQNNRALKIVRVESGSVGSQLGFQPGDVVRGINGRPFGENAMGEFNQKYRRGMIKGSEDLVIMANTQQSNLTTMIYIESGHFQ